MNLKKKSTKINTDRYRYQQPLINLIYTEKEKDNRINNLDISTQSIFEFIVYSVFPVSLKPNRNPYLNNKILSRIDKTKYYIQNNAHFRRFFVSILSKTLDLLLDLKFKQLEFILDYHLPPKKYQSKTNFNLNPYRNVITSYG